MTSPQDPPPAWTAPGAGEEARPAAPPPEGREPGAPPPGQAQPPSQWGPAAAPPAGWGGSPPPAGWGAPPQPGYGPQPGPGQAPAYGQAPGWAPAAGPRAWRPPALQPGIVPLRPLSLGEILDGAMRAIRANPAVMFGLSAAVVTIGVLISAVLSRYVAGLLAGTFADLTTMLDPSFDPTLSGELDGQFSGALAQLATAPVTSVATTVLTGLLVVSVSRSVLGRTIRVGEVVRSWRVWWVLGFTVLLGAASLLAVGLVVGAVVLLARQDQTGAAVAVGLVALLALVVATVWVTTRTLLVTPALMLEGKGFWATVARAWRLTRGSFWRLLGIYLLVAVLMSVLSQLVAAPFSVLATVVGGGGDIFSPGPTAIISVGEVIALTASTTYTSAVVALLYIDVRMRREGLDIELGRAAAADAAAAR